MIEAGIWSRGYLISLLFVYSLVAIGCYCTIKVLFKFTVYRHQVPYKYRDMCKGAYVCVAHLILFPFSGFF